VTSVRRRQASLADPLVNVERQLRVWVVMEWLAHAEIEPGPLVSVIVPTCDRRPWLARAVASVMAQSYPIWELVVVDDASADDTWEWLQTLSDPRIRILRGPGGSGARARNIGLDHAAGDVIAYLDDDNLMHPRWLQAVAWAFSRWRDADFLYGARIIEDDRSNPVVGGAFPSLEFFPFDRVRLEEGNYIDMNVQAHRAGPATARFDDQLQTGQDWDLALKLTGHRPPLELPAIACSYTSGAPNRLSTNAASAIADFRLVWARAHTSRPLRVVAHTTRLTSESDVGIGEDLTRFHGQGGTVALSQPSGRPRPVEGPWPVFHALADAVREVNPDVIVVYGCPPALDDLEKLEVPFALCVDGEGTTGIEAHALCIGMWASSAHPRSLQDELSDALTSWRLARAQTPVDRPTT
jgi:hypothetical protein